MKSTMKTLLLSLVTLTSVPLASTVSKIDQKNNNTNLSEDDISNPITKNSQLSMNNGKEDVTEEQIRELAAELNVTFADGYIDPNDSVQMQEIMIQLTTYKEMAEMHFINMNKEEFNKGFLVTIKDIEGGMRSFLDSNKYDPDDSVWSISPKTNRIKVQEAITKAAVKMLNNVLSEVVKSVELHGYSVEELMGDRVLPQTKQEIDDFENGMSWGDWLQAQANSKYHSWQLTMGLGVGIPGVVFLLAIITFGWWRYNVKYNPAGARKRLKPRKIKIVKNSAEK